MEVRVLGPVEVLIGGTPVRLAKRQHRLILGILGVEVNRTVSSGQLIELLWPGRPPARPRAVLHSRMSELRALLRAAGDGPVQSIATGDDGYVLRIPTPAVDAHRFRELIGEARSANLDLRMRDVLREALGLWRGPVLGGWSPGGPAGALFSSLEAARLTAVEDLYEVELRLGNHRAVADELVLLSAAHPTRDRLTSAVMLALHRAGRSAEAVSVYHQRRVWLSTELGVDPAPALQHLHVAVLRHDPALAQMSRPGQLDRPA